MRVELITIGTELLRGFVVNTHAVYLGRHLTALGGSLVRQVCVDDSRDGILNSLKQALNDADVVITTGGLGPTSDDITKDLVVELLKLKTRVDEAALENVIQRFKRRSLPLSDSIKGQAVVPDSALVLQNANGTAPGLAIPINRDLNFKSEWLIMLPGPPREMHPMFENQVAPFLKEKLAHKLPTLECRILKVTGMGESSIAERIEPVLKDIPELEIGYCARIGEVDVRLLIQGKDPEIVRRNVDSAESRVKKVLGEHIFGKGNDQLETVVIDLLRSKNQFMTTVESCTGGYLSNRITSIPGSGDVFREGWVTYSDHAKAKMLGVPGHLLVEHGAVSEIVAKEMAERARVHADVDFALSTTGFAGPNGGAPDKPVGTVFIGLATKLGTRVQKFMYPYDRETFKFVVSQTALNMLRCELLQA